MRNIKLRRVLACAPFALGPFGIAHATDGPKFWAFDNHLELDSGSQEAKLEEIATQGLLSFAVIQVDWGAIENPKGTFDWQTVTDQLTFWANNNSNLLFIFRIVPYKSPYDTNSTVGAPPWIYSTSPTVDKIYVHADDTGSAFIPKTWTAGAGPSNFEGHLQDFLDALNVRYDTSTYDGSFIWACGGELAFSTVFGNVEWAQAIERESSEWSPCNWQTHLSTVETYVETNATYLRPLAAFSTLFTYTRTNFAVQPHVDALSLAAINNGSAVMFTGLAQNTNTFNGRQIPHYVCYLDSQVGLTSSDTILTRDDDTLYECGCEDDPGCHRNSSDLSICLQEAWSVWEDISGKAYSMGLMTTADEILGTVDIDPSVDCYYAAVDAAFTDLFEPANNVFSTPDVTLPSCTTQILRVDVSRPENPGGPPYQPQDGHYWRSAYKGADGLRRALADATFGTEIWVADGTYKASTAVDETKTHSVGSGIVVLGGFHGDTSYDTGGETAASQRNPATNACILNGALSGGSAFSQHVVQFPTNADACILDGFIVENGVADGTGLDADGGGILVKNQARPMIVNCLITGNSANGDGAGVFVQQLAAPVFMDCRFSSNGASGNGGACFSDGAGVEFVNSTFRANYATAGGAIYAQVENATENPNLTLVTNCTFYGNEAMDSTVGGGILAEVDGNLFLKNSIWWQNCAHESGDGCDSGTITQDAQVYWTTAVDDDWHLEFNYCCIDIGSAGSLAYPLNAGTGNITDDPNFVNAGTGNLRPLKTALFTSPCINTGSNGYVPCMDLADLDKGGANDRLETLPKDLDLGNRIVCTTVDMGAYEYPSCSWVGGGMRAEGGGEPEGSDDPALDCYLDDGTDEELAERCAS